MAKIVVTNRENKAVEIEANVGISIMENIRNAGIDDLLALCGGCCSCATCHVYVEDNAGCDLGEIASDEDGLLDCSDFRKENSRLSCQILVTEAMSGLSVTLAPED